MQEHLFSSSCDGALHDTRVTDWHKLSPLRPVFKRTFGEICTTQEFKATLRNGRFAWPGGYPLYFICSDGAALCFACARKEARNVLHSIQCKTRDGWWIVATDVNYEDNDLHCAHCADQIELAYGED